MNLNLSETGEYKHKETKGRWKENQSQSSEHFKWLYTNVRCMGNKPEELGILIHN